MSHIFVEHVIKATLGLKEKKEDWREGLPACLLAKKFMLLDLQPTRSVTEREGRDAQNVERYKKFRGAF